MLLHFDAAVATLAGLPAAVLFDNIAYWVTTNAACRRNLHGGCAWTYNTIDAFAAQFPFLTPRTIRTALGKLQRAGLLRSGCYNRDPMDHTTWYTLTEEGQRLYDARKRDAPREPPKKQNGCIDAAETSHRAAENAKPTMNTNKKRSYQKQQPPDEPKRESGEAANRHHTTRRDGEAPDADDAAFAEIARLFSDNIHPVTGAIERDVLASCLADYGRDWTLAAITEAAEHHGQSVRYVTAILERWRRDGFRTQTKPTKKGAPHGQDFSGHPAARAADSNAKWDHESSGW